MLECKESSALKYKLADRALVVLTTHKGTVCYLQPTCVIHDPLDEVGGHETRLPVHQLALVEPILIHLPKHIQIVPCR